MKTGTYAPNRRMSSAYMLVEALVYISVVMLLVGIGFVAMYKCINNSLALRRGADDISRALNAGERWRQDIRNATAVRWESSEVGKALVLERADRTNSYCFSGSNIVRRVGSGPWLVVVQNVKASEMSELQNPATWRWDLELYPRSKKSRILPLFTALAVPNTSAR